MVEQDVTQYVTSITNSRITWTQAVDVCQQVNNQSNARIMFSCSWLVVNMYLILKSFGLLRIVLGQSCSSGSCALLVFV